MKNLKAGFAVAVLIAGAILLFLQHQAQEKLRAQNEALAQQLAQLQTDNQNLSDRLAAAGDSKSLSDEQLNELLKLRGEVGILRQQAHEEINEANQRTQAAEQKLATALSAQDKFTAQETETINDMKQLGLAEMIYAGDNNGQFATNFDQMTNELGSLYTNPEIYKIDFMNAGIVSRQYPQMIMFRERIARQASDGTWHRIYGFADGRVITATSYDGNFDVWEKANTYSPPPDQ